MSMISAPDFRVRLRGGMQVRAARLGRNFKLASAGLRGPPRARRPPAPRAAAGAEDLDPPSPRAQIFIKTLTGRKQAMTLEPSDEVRTIKQSLQEKEGIQVDQIRLIYSGKQLADDKKIEFYNIQAGGTIHMVLQLRGGAR